MSQTIKFAVVGCGMMAAHHLNGYREIIPLSNYGREQFEAVKYAYTLGKYSNKEYEHEIKMMIAERIIEVKVF